MAKWDKFGTDFDEERGIKKDSWSEFYDDFETVKDKLYQEYQQKVSGIVKTNKNKKLDMDKWNNYRDMVEVYCDAEGTSSLKERKFYSDTEGRSPLEALRMHLEAGGPWASPQEMMKVMDCGIHQMEKPPMKVVLLVFPLVTATPIMVATTIWVTYGYFWSSSEGSSSNAWIRLLYYGSSLVGRIEYYKQSGFSIRCLGD